MSGNEGELVSHTLNLPPAVLSVTQISLSLSLSHTHTHTHTVCHYTAHKKCTSSILAKCTGATDSDTHSEVQPTHYVQYIYCSPLYPYITHTFIIFL